MDHHLEPKKVSNHRRSFGTPEKIVLPRASQRPNPRDRIRSDKHGLSYADMHHEIMKNVEDVGPKHLENRLKEQIGRKAAGQRGVIKYKSYLPGYVKKDANLQEQVSDVGVLDSGSPEKWCYGNKKIPKKSTRHSVSSTTTNSSLFDDESSTDSSRDHSYSPSRLRMHHRPLQFYLMSSHSEGHSGAGQPSGESVGNPQVHMSAQGDTLKDQRRSMVTDEHFYQNPSSTRFKQHEKRDFDVKVDPPSGIFPNGTNCNVSPCTKVKVKTQDDDFQKRGEKCEEGNLDARDQDVRRKEKTAAIFVPRIISQKSQAGVSKFSDSAMLLAGRLAEKSRKNFLDRLKEGQNGELNSDQLFSCPYPREVDGDRHFQLKHVSCVDTGGNKFSSVRSCSAPRSTRTETSPPKCRNLQYSWSTLTSTNVAANEHFRGSDLQPTKVASERARSISPFRRLSFSLGKTSKSSISKDGGTLLQVSSTYVSARPGSENPAASSCTDDSCHDKGTATSRAKSSPLRRLLEPLVKPKASKSCKFPEPSQKGSTSSHGRLKSLYEQPCSSAFQSREGTSSTVQALLRVTVKNNQPLFTFAVDEERDVIAATVRKPSTAEKDDCSCIYTFFTIQEVKKKHQKSPIKKINHGGNGQCQNYVSNVVARMQVSSSQPSSSGRGNQMDQGSRIREFVLFDFDVGQEDRRTSDAQPSNEVAAIVIKILKRTNRNLAKDIPESCHEEYLADLDTTVILPSGIHSLPHRGGPSSLIQRWKSGGSCDCGGWDIGCNLRILTNQHQPSKSSSSSQASPISDQFELFFQGGVQGKRPFFRLALFKNGIYSVEYNSSLSLLQAFSISIAVCNSKKLLEVPEPSNSHEVKTFGEIVFVQNDRPKPPGPLEGDIPAQYVSYPPLSPVGRV